MIHLCLQMIPLSIMFYNRHNSLIESYCELKVSEYRVQQLIGYTGLREFILFLLPIYLFIIPFLLPVALSLFLPLWHP